MSTSSISGSPAYVTFRSSVPKKSVDIAAKVWKYYELGRVPPSSSSSSSKQPQQEVLVMLHGTSGTAECFFQQLLYLGSKGYAVIAATIPSYQSPLSFVQGFKGFLQALNIQRVHLFGASLGGYLALQTAAYLPDVVSSLILCNSFCDTLPFQQNSTCLGMVDLMPEFYVKGYILDSFPKRSEFPEAVDFMVECFDTLSRKMVASRLLLNCAKSTLGDLKLGEDRITVMESTDEVVTPPSLTHRLHERFPKAKTAQLKCGGDFPFLAVPSDVCLHIQLHLRNMGVEPQQPQQPQPQPSTPETKTESDGKQEQDTTQQQPQQPEQKQKKKQTHFLTPSSSTKKHFVPSTYADQSGVDVVRGAQENLLATVSEQEAAAKDSEIRSAVERERKAREAREAAEQQEREKQRKEEEELKQKRSKLMNQLVDPGEQGGSVFE